MIATTKYDVEGNMTTTEISQAYNLNDFVVGGVFDIMAISALPAEAFLELLQFYAMAPNEVLNI